MKRRAAPGIRAAMPPFYSDGSRCSPDSGETHYLMPLATLLIIAAVALAIYLQATP